MNKNAKKWVKALRSGKYKQGKDRLRTGDKFCCLGVACDLYKKETNKDYKGSRKFLPRKIQKWLKLKSPHGSFGFNTLTTINDCEGKTFKQIANIIEKHIDELFT